MSLANKSFRRVVILADETAHWKIAGLRQLDRLALMLNELLQADANEQRPRICIYWRPDIPSEERWLPQRQPASFEMTSDVSELTDASSGIDLLLSTHWFPTRSSKLLTPARGESLPEPSQNDDQSWQACLRHCEEAFRFERSTTPRIGQWKYIADRNDIPGCENSLLRDNVKTQDGFISRFVNRPISRPVTRLLLKLSITPSAWTLMILIFPIAGSLALARSDYWGFVLGTILYQIYSVLDGCDGEIARAKYLESERGRRLDNFCDHAANLLMVLCLSIGLFRDHAITDVTRVFYLGEGILAVILIALNEALLSSSDPAANAKPDLLRGALYPRHRELISQSGVLFLGEKLSWWLVQMTKRDVSLFVFVILAVIARPQWILHLLAAFAIISLMLAGKARINRRRERQSAASPRTP